MTEALLVLADGTTFEGEAFGAEPPGGVTTGEAVFNTVMPATPWRARKASRDSVERQLLGRRARSRTTTPRQNGRTLSSSAGVTP